MHLRPQNRLLAALPERSRDELLRHAQHFPLAVGEVIYDVGDRFTHAVLLEHGVVSEMTRFADGSETESATIGNESKIGPSSLLMQQVATRRYVVRIAGAAHFIPVDRLDAAIRSDLDARDVYMRLGQAMLDSALQLTACNGAHSIEQRTARWLLQAHDRIPGDALFLKQATLAEALGARRATVSEICGRFSEAGAIAYTRGHVRIVDRTALEGFSCECHGVIRRAFERALTAR